tara:strand:+ start:1004 stop:4957 length:3954 start_codon:yes stop_codon:yes gene_type:complete
MAAAARQATGPSLVPWVLFGAVVAAGAGLWFGYPGLILLVVGVAVAAFLAPPAILTGKKDSNGFPTAISPGEQVAMNRFRMWGELKWRSITPSADWLPGWPIRMWWLVSLPLSAAALAFPSPELGEGWRLANALGVFITINVLNGALRRWTAPDDLCDGPTVETVITEVRREPKTIAALGGGAVLAIVVFIGSLIAVDKLHFGYIIDPMQPWHLATALALTALLTVVTLAVRGAALAKWRTMVRVRAEWAPRWQIAKIDPSPHLIDHSEHGPVQVDTFEAHPSVGSSAIYPLVGKITASVGPGSRIAVLESPNVDSQGQPVAGSKHPLRFRIVTFISDDMPDLCDPAVEADQAELLIASAASWVADATGAGRWVFLDAAAIHDAEPDEDGETGSGAWVAHFSQPDGPDLSWMRNNGLGDFGASVNGEALLDHKTGDVYLGALTQETTRFQDPRMEKRLKDLALTDVWGSRWGNILKMGAVQPRPEHGVYAEAKLGHVELFRQPFVVQQGMDPLEFFKLEPKISTTLSAAPFVSVTGFSGSGDRPGERHPQAFCVTWSTQPVASNPDKLVPTDGMGPRWVLSGRINQAFDAARLARPEVSDVRALTDRSSRGHVWEIKLRLYGGVTLAEVRTASQKLRQHLGSDWLRVAQAQDGCVIVAGADPKDTRKVVFARPEQKNRDFVTSLDWEQAFSDAKLQNSAGVLPRLAKSAVLPSNSQVQVLDFVLPGGTDRTMVKGATSKLQASTGNAFVEVRPSPLGADHVQMLVSREHPLPSSASVDWEAVDSSDGALFFATGVEGEPVGFNPKSDPHILVAGASGGGKSVSLQVLLYAAVVSDAEIYLIDPMKGGADFQFASPYSRAFAATVDEAAAVMKAVYTEVLRRRDLNAAHAVGGYRELPDDVRPKHIYLVMDEFTSLMQPDPVSKTASEDPEVEREREEGIAKNQQKAYIGTMAGKIAREARSAGVTLVLATQKLSAKMLDDIPGAGDLKTNLARMLMGNATFGEKQSALKSATEAPELGDVVPKGRGLWESTEANARVMQVWFEPSQATFAAKLEERREKLGVEQKLDLSPFMRSTESAEQPLPSERQRPEFQGEPEVVTVGEFEFSLDDLDDLDGLGELEDAVAESPVDESPVVAVEPEAVELAVAPVVVTEHEALPAPVYEADPTVVEQGGDLGTTLILAAAGADVEAYRDRGELVTLPQVQTTEADLHGWWKIDAALLALDAHPGTDTVVWVDSELDDEDDLGIPFVELAREVFEFEGLAFEGHAPVRSAQPAEPVAPAPKAKPKAAKRKLPDIESPDFAEPSAPRATTIFDELF